MDNGKALPELIRKSFEKISGFDLGGVRVHYNSGKPAEIEAHAYTDGTNIYIAPGCEDKLAHELGHVIQQMQRRVKPNGMINGIPSNNDAALEADAENIVKRAMALVNAEKAAAATSAQKAAAAIANAVKKATENIAKAEKAKNTADAAKKGKNEKNGNEGTENENSEKEGSENKVPKNEDPKNEGLKNEDSKKLKKVTNDEPIIQRSAISKATTAFLYTKKHIVAGNQKGQVISSLGASTVNLNLLRNYVDPLIRDLKGILQKSLNPVINAIACGGAYEAEIRPFVSAQMAVLLQAGNCGEFADVVYKYLIETSGNKVQVYKCYFARDTGADHAFNLIYEGDRELFASVPAMAALQDKVIVADTWGNYKDTLGSYLNRGNPYNRVFQLAEVIIENKCKGVNKPAFAPEVTKLISSYVGTIRSKADLAEAVALAERAVLDDPIAGMYDSVDPSDPTTFTLPYLLEKLETEISGRNVVLHKINMLQRRELFEILPQIDMDLYNRCKALYSTTEWHDITH